MTPQATGRTLALACLVWAVGCGPDVVPTRPSASSESSGNPGSSSTTTGDPAPQTTTSTTSGSGGLDSTTTATSTTMGAGFLADPDVGRGFECNIYLQDCPSGQKCTLWANDGGSSWNATRCVPIVDNPDASTEPCTVEGSAVSGLDSCDFGLMCWDVDPQTGVGVCRSFCTGSQSRPTCDDPNDVCFISSSLELCLPVCDPLVQDCPAGEGCYAVNQYFTCVPDGSEGGGAAGDPCEFINVCIPGLACVNSDVVPGCKGAIGCCSAFCDVSRAVPSCPAGQECLPWYRRGQGKPGDEDVGVCGAPQ